MALSVLRHFVPFSTTKLANVFYITCKIVQNFMLLY